MDSLKVLSTMKFVNKNGKAVSIPTIKNWEMTIKGELLYSGIISFQLTYY